MAELIDKKALLDKLRRTTKYFDVKYDIEKMPTVTEADIRNKAISDTIEAIKEHTRIVGSTTCEDLEQLAEQLKEEQ